MQTSVVRFAIWLLLASAVGELVKAQVSPAEGMIAGVVLDQSHLAIPGARISLRRTKSDLLRQVVSGAGGAFLIGPVPPSSYMLTIEAAGFAVVTMQAVIVHVGETTSLAPVLQPEPVQLEIEVTADASPIDFTRTNPASSIDRTNLEDLPVNRRNYLDLALLTPAVVETTTLVDSADFRPPLTPAAGIGFAGNNGRGNSFLVDGISINGASYNVRPSLPQVAVQEFQVNRSGFSSELGGSSGGVVNIVSRSGSNAWSGEVFAYLRHSSLQARNYFDPSRASYTRTQPGGSLSGPLGRRTFLFAGFEALEEEDSAFVPILQDRSVLSRLTPSQESLVGFLSASGDPGWAALGAALKTALNPSSNPAVKQIFQQNSGVFPFASRTRQFDTRLDHYTLSQQSIFARFNFTADHTDNSRLGALVGLSNGSSNRWLDLNYVLGADWSFSPTWRAETRLAFADSRFRILPNDAVGPEVVIQGYGQFGQNSLLPLDQHERYTEIQQIFQFTKRRHLFRFGADFLPIYNSSQVNTYFGGRFLFGQAIPLSAIIDASAGTPGLAAGLAQQFMQSGNPDVASAVSQPITSLQSYSLGLPLAYIQGFGNTAYTAWRQNHSLFAQDYWRIRSDLTLSLGLRYQMDWPGVIRPVENIDPRFGFAWAPRNSGATVIRGGFGTFHQWVMPPIPFGQLQINRPDVNLIFLPLSGVPGVVNPQTGNLLTSADVYTSLLSRGVLGTRPITQADLTPLGLPPGFRFPEKGGVQSDYHSPYSEQFSLSLEHAFGSLVANVSYEYSRAAHLWRVRDHNLVDLGTQPDGLPIIGRLDPGYANIYYYESAANAFYSAMTLEISRRFRRYVGFDAHYTLSRATDEVTDFNLEYQPNNQFDARADRGLSPFHQKHRFVLSGILQSPWTQNSGRHPYLSDWTFSSTAHAHSFEPFNLLTGDDNVGDGQVTTHRPIGLGRDVGVGPDFFSLDARLMRALKLKRERSTLTITLDAFNVLNRTNFQSVNNIVGDVPLSALPKRLVGRRSDPTLPFSFTAANDPRQIQLGAKLSF